MAKKEKRSKEEVEREKRIEAIKKIIEARKAEMELRAPPKVSMFRRPPPEKGQAAAGVPPAQRIVTREYREFIGELERTRILRRYERFCKIFGKFKVTPSPAGREALSQAIAFTSLKVTPEEVTGASVLSAMLGFLAAIPVLFLPILAIFKILVLVAPVGVAYLVYTYPTTTANLLRIRTGRDLVIAVLYMIVYMKTSPNIEGAVRFAASNLSGKLADDLKHVLWKVEIGQFSTVEEALTEYILTWRAYNREFIEAVQLIRESMLEGMPERRDALLDKAIDIILIGTDEKMKKYARDLQMPITVLHGAGVMLPVMGMIVFPLITIFMGEAVANMPAYLFVGYNVLLPLFIYFFMRRILDKRPSTHTTVDVTEHPDYVPISKMRLGRSMIPVLPIAIAIGLLIAFPGILFAAGTGFYGSLKDCPQQTDVAACTAVPGCVWAQKPIPAGGTRNVCEPTPLGLPMSILVIFGAAIGAIFYFWASSFQKVKMREAVVEVESEFEDALFALGNRLSGGVPVETALVQAEEDTKELGISEMFRIIIKNIQKLGMTFKQALFDPEYGALRYYPSRLIKTIMKSVSETVEKGTRAASLTMLTISRYLRDIHSTQEKIADLLSETVSSMRFQAYVLVPVISGIVVAVADLILRMVAQLSATFAKITPLAAAAPEAGVEIPNPAELLFGLKSATPPEVLQFIVGIYVVEIIILLGIFINRIDVGEDLIKQNDTVWKLLLVGVIMYIIVLIGVKGVFGPLVDVASAI